MNTPLSKSEKKRRAKGIEQLVHELAALPGREIALLPCTQEIKDELSSARGLKGGSRNRQLKYVTKLLRDKPVDELYDFLAQKKGSLLKKNHEFQKLEHLRNLLLDEAVRQYEDIMHNRQYIEENEPLDLLSSSAVLQEIADKLPGIDPVLLRATAVQFARTRNRKFSRELFRILKAAQEKAYYSQNKGKENGI